VVVYGRGKARGGVLQAIRAEPRAAPDFLHPPLVRAVTDYALLASPAYAC
jgi:hypothetical protein